MTPTLDQRVSTLENETRKVSEDNEAVKVQMMEPQRGVSNLGRELKSFRDETAKNFADVREEVRTGFASVRGEMTGRFTELRTEMNSRFERVDARLNRMDGKLEQMDGKLELLLARNGAVAE